MRIRVRKYPSGSKRYVLDYGLVDGKKRKEVVFKSKREAEDALDDAEKGLEERGRMGLGMTPADMAELVVARERLQGVPLLTAVEYYLAHAAVVRMPITMGTMIMNYMDSIPEENLGSKWRSSLEKNLNSLARSVAPAMAHQVTKEQVETWLNGNGWKPKTRQNYLAGANALFAWGASKHQGHVAVNPCADIVRVRIIDQDIEALNVAQAELLLLEAWKDPLRRLLGFVVLGLFCGVRPEELQKVRWSDVNLEERTVIVMGTHAKTRKRRVVDISENAVAWLKGWVPTNEPKITPKAFPWHWPRLRKNAGWTPSGEEGENPWPHDAMRHTYASMHYAKHQNENLLQAQMGHEDDEMLFKHYRAMQTRAEAEKFWQPMPPRLNFDDRSIKVER